MSMVVFQYGPDI